MKFPWHWTSWHWTMTHNSARWAMSALLAAACGCGTVGPQRVAKTSADPFLDVAGPTAVGAAKYPAPDSRQISASTRPRSTVRGASPDGPSELPAGVPNGAIVRTGAEMRILENPFCPCPVIDETPCASAKDYPDEYLCDGGDRDFPISYNGPDMQGLESEDAAVEYYDDLNRRHVKPTNKVCVYAPRFASVSSISEPVEGVGGGRPVQSFTTLGGTGLVNRQGVFAQHQRDGAERLVTRERGSGVTTSTNAEAVEQPVAALNHAHTAVIAEKFAFLKTGIMQQGEEARLAASITSALELSRNEYPVITAKLEQGVELRSRFMQHELVGRESKGRGKIRIVKLVDKTVAAPGDIVTFTIRYDNIGDGELHDVMIVDNLTPRLEYIDDSAESDPQGRLDVQDNGEGSLILKWIIDEPVPAGKGGVVSFKALVR
jgi:uncharacterized repeat protein (TIGR01451 family)